MESEAVNATLEEMSMEYELFKIDFFESEMDRYAEVGDVIEEEAE